MFNFVLRPRKSKSAETAKERLQILLAHERSDGALSPDFLPMLQREILEVVRKHIRVERDMVDIKLDRGNDISSLEINIELPNATRMSKVAGR